MLNRLAQLQNWGSEDRSGQPFGSILLATVSGASSAGRVDYVAHIFARRDAGHIVYSMADDAGGDLHRSCVCRWPRSSARAPPRLCRRFA